MRTPGQFSRTLPGSALALPFVFAIILASAPLSPAFQETAATPKSGQAELTSHETQPTFKLKSERNLVVVRVVVRDSKGNALGNLRQEDFRLLDNGKPQSITHFTVETPSSAEAARATARQTPTADTADEGALEGAQNAPRRFLAMFFDDIHMRIDDNMRVQMAATKYVTNALLPGDRVGVFTSSGRNQMDFTDDLDKVRQAISQIIPRPVISNPENICPEIFDYQAYLIVHERNTFATDIAIEEDFHCNCEQFQDNPRMADQCRQQGVTRAESTAMQVLQVFETNTQASLRSLGQLVRHLSAYPGQRTILLVSPGFLARSFESQLDEIVERSLHANITVNALDAKGLYAPLPGGDDISQRTVITPKRPDLVGHKEQFRLDRLTMTDEPLRNLASDTGGTFFHNSNDLDAGFRKAGALPEVYYVLGFSPTILKRDGQYHSLKVSLVQPAGLSLQSRRGYFAPSSSADPATKVKDEIEEAVFSQDELNELPIDVHTQFFRVDESIAKLSILTHVDLRFIHFRKQEGRNLDNLTLVTVLFDHDGKYVTGQEKTLEMRLFDSSLEKLAHSGITMKTSFDVKPGTYVVRQVVRDAEGAQLSGLSRPIEIP